MSDRKHLVFIINPKSGTDRVKALADAIAANLDSASYSYEIQHTAKAKHGTELAVAAAVAGAYGVVAVGGDGSVNDVAAGLTGTGTLLGIVPKGSGNGLARTLGIPLESAAAIRALNNGNIEQIDIGYANEHLFLSNAGVGFDAQVARGFAESKRRGLAAYSWLTTKYLWTYKSLPYTIIIDGKELAETAFMINVANGQQFGYNFKIAPEASWTDGLLDVIIIKKFPVLLGGALVLRAVMGTILKSPYVRHYRGKEVIIRQPQLSAMQTDGDLYACGHEVRYRVEEGKLGVMV